jgi:hypothetical protein
MRVFMAGFVILLTLLAGRDARADTWGLHLGSRHLPSDGAYNGFNPGAYWRSNEGLTVGTYWNSERKPSVYAGYTADLFGGHMQLTLGGITGYSYGRLAPLVVPSVKLGDFRLAFLPRTPKSVSTVHLMLEF